MYPIAEFFIMLADIVFIVLFGTYQLRHGKRRPIDHLFLVMGLCLLVWQVAVLGMRLCDGDDTTALFILDAVSNIGVACLPPATLLVAMAFSKRLNGRRGLYLFAPSAVSVLLVFTNPLHHLYYERFSIYASSIKFGSYFFVQGAYGYFCLLSALIIILRYARRSKNKICMRQAALFSVSIIVPLTINMLATFSIASFTIAATPLAFTLTLLCQAAAIYLLGLLNLAPIASQRIADCMTDAYVVFDQYKNVYSCNKNFTETFAARYRLEIGQALDEAFPLLNDENRSFLYNLRSALGSSEQARGSISYEQTVLSDGRKRYCVVEVTPLFNGMDIGGYLALFKDVTRLREAMQREQEDLSRSMERERLASLGQMIGGIAHNLKTPIMSVSGSASMLDNLVTEWRESLGDPEITEEDYRAIMDEMADWLEKIHGCCTYMSDIITTVKGLAANMNASENGEFTLDELMKRVFLLLQHELKRSKCHMEFVNELPKAARVSGDVNNLVQVVSNLVSNAVDAMPDGGEILVRAFQKEDQICLSVKDSGTGVPPHIRGKLFKEMFTSKGAKGTGLGLYMSLALMRGKFGGRLWLESTSPQGSEFCLSIPAQEKEQGEGDAREKE